MDALFILVDTGAGATDPSIRVLSPGCVDGEIQTSMAGAREKRAGDMP